jgi:tetratricopeptide (TPR) repeat protein
MRNQEVAVSLLQGSRQLCKIMLRIIVFLIFQVAFCQSALTSDVIDLLNEGKIDEARRLVAESSTATLRDGTLLYYQALLEPDGQKSMQFHDAAFKAEMEPQFLEHSTYLRALYHLADRNYEKLGATSEAYLQYWENGKYRAEVLRLAALAFKKQNEFAKSDRFRKNLIDEFAGSRTGKIGQLDEAVRLYEKKDYLAAQKICRKLSNSKYDEIVPPALYLLSGYSIEQNRIDDAILYYNILKETYPTAVGLDDLMNRLGQLYRESDNSRAERLTGTIYSVQVGVFFIKDNAKRLAERMKQYGEKVEIANKIVSDKKYYVVFAGQFQSTEEAMVFKSRLEMAEKEAFQVVAR